MRNVPLPSDDLPPHVRSTAACLAAILELEIDDVPTAETVGRDTWIVWREWLAGRGLGLIAVPDPATFSWPGPWLALLAGRGPLAGHQVAAIAFGVPSGLVWKPLSGPETFEDIVGGFAIAPHDAALWVPRAAAWDRREGRVEAIAIARAPEIDMDLVSQATAHAGRGLEGDRYFAGTGTFSNPNVRGTDLTLVEAETFEQVTLPTGHLDFEQARRNVITRGIDLNALVGERFFVGDVECLGQRLCEPCAHLQRLTAPGVLRGLVHRGGLRADIVSGGTICVGDAVRRA